IKKVHKEPPVILRLLILLVVDSFDYSGDGLFRLQWFWTLLILPGFDFFDSQENQRVHKEPLWTFSILPVVLDSFDSPKFW
ncbi:7777_t:CDS:2, partial [Cetraspora pellucida]